MRSRHGVAWEQSYFHCCSQATPSLYFTAMERSQEMPGITSMSCAPNKCVSAEIVMGVWAKKWWHASVLLSSWLWMWAYSIVKCTTKVWCIARHLLMYNNSIGCFHNVGSEFEWAYWGKEGSSFSGSVGLCDLPWRGWCVVHWNT